MPFLVRDIAGDKSARKELAEKYGRLSVPTIVIEGKVFVGFNENRSEIEKALFNRS